MTQNLVLYYFPLSTSSQKVRLCQFHKGIRLETRVVDLRKLEQLDPAYLAINRNGHVPTLVVDGQPIVESSIINEFFEETHPDPPLLPRDPVQRAQVRAWTKYLDAEPSVKIAAPTYRAWVAPSLAAVPQEALLATISQAPHESTRARLQRTALGQISDQEIEEAYRELDLMLARMDARLAEGPWLFGDSYTLADLETVPIVLRLQHLGRFDLVTKWQRVFEWFERVQRLPSFTETYAFLNGQST